MNVVQNRRTEMRIICSSVGIYVFYLCHFDGNQKWLFICGEVNGKNTLLIRKEKKFVSFNKVVNNRFYWLEILDYICWDSERLFENKYLKLEENVLRLVFCLRWNEFYIHYWILNYSGILGAKIKHL